MYFSLKKHSHIRIYGEFGYIVSPRLHRSNVFNKTGGAFLSVLTHEKKDFDQLIEKISQIIKVPKSCFVQDVYEFFQNLVIAGYLDSDIQVVAPIQSENMVKKNSVENFFSKQFSETPILRSCQIEITSTCNERCIHCYILHEQKCHFLPFSDIKNLFSQLSDIGCLSITLSGGEVFTHPDILKILELLQKYDFSISILSNLTLLTDEAIELLKKIDIDTIHVSVYSLKPETHDFITKLDGSLQKTLTNIEKCLKNDIPIKISCPTMKANYKDFEKLLIWGNSNNIQVLTDYNIMARSDNSTDNLEQRLSEEEAAVVINAIIKNDKSYQKLIMQKCETPIEIDIDASICHVGRDKICISSTGNFYPCPGWHEMIVGNIKDDTLQSVWKNSDKLNWLRSLKRAEISKCLGCVNKDFCLLCIQRNYNETKDVFTVPEHFCKIAALNKKLVSVYRNEIR